MKRLNILFVSAIFISFISCTGKGVYEKNVSIKDASWNFSDTILFDANIADTVSSNNIYINIRTSSDYPYSNIFLFITTHAPNGNLLKDTFGIHLADEAGKWYGKGIGNIYSLQVPYKANIKFPFRGIYTFELQHGMWNKDLTGVSDIGIRIENLN